MGTFIKEGLIKASENLPKMGAFIREGLSKIKSGGIGTFFKEGLSKIKSSGIGTFFGEGLSKIKSSGIGTFFGEGLSKIKSSGIGTFFKEGLSKIGIGGGATVAEKVATSGLPKTGIGTVAKWGAKKIPLLGALIDAGFSAFDEYGESTKKGESKKTAKKRAAVVGASTGLGSGLGVWGGAAAGAAIGSAVPIIGTVVGGIVGGIIGSIAGGYGGKKAGQAISGATIKGEAEKKNTTDISKNAKEITKEAKTAAPLEKAKAEDMEKQKKTTMEIIRELDKQNKNVVAIVQKNEQITKAMSDQLNLLKSMGLLTADKLASSFDIMMSSAKASQAETERAINKVGTSLIDLRKNLNLTEEEAAKFKQAQDSIASEDYDKGIQELSKAYADLKRKKTEALKDLEIKNPKITLDNKPINELTEAEKEAKKQADLLKVQIANIDRQMGMSTQNANNYYSSLQKGGQAIQMAYSEGIKYADEMSDAAERRISTERKLQETAMLGMAPSIEMMQQQIDQQKQLATDYAKARDLGREKALSELGIQGARGNALIEELRMAKSKNDLEAIAVKYKMEEGDAMSKLKPMYIEEQNAATKIAEANQKILDLTKQVREGYLSAIQEMSIGNTEYTKIIGTQEMGVTQLMTTVNKASKEMNRLNTLTLGGITSDKTTGIEPIAQMAVGPVGPQLQVSPQASKNMNRIYEWEESSREIKNMSQGNSTGKNYNAGEALANSAYLTPIQDGKPHSFKSIPATLENTLMDASKLTAGEKKRGESVPTQVNLGANIINNAKLGTGEYDIKAMTVANAVIQNLQGVASGALGASKTVEKAGAAQNKPSTFAYNLWANSPNTSALAQSSVAAEAPLTKAVEKIAKTVPVMVQAAEKMNQAATKINTDNSDKKSNRKLEGKDENFAERQRALERQKVTRTRDLETTIRRNAAAARAVERQEKKAKEREEREEKVKAAKKAEKKDNTKEIKHHVPVSKKESTAKRDTFSKSGVPKSNYLEYIGPESAFPKRGVSKANYLEGRNAKAVTTATGLYDAKEMQASKDALVQQEKNEEILKGYREYANLRDAPKIQTEAMKQDEAIKKGISVANRLNDHFASSGNKEKVNITVTVKQDGQLACTLQRAAALVSELAPAGSTRHQN
jgi:hypothetical protein